MPSNEELLQENTRLQAEVEQQKAISKAYIASDGAKDLRIIATERERDALQSELAKARELVSALQSDYACCLEAGYDRITQLGGDCDSVQKMLADNPNYAKSVAYLSNQSAPAAKDDL